MSRSGYVDDMEDPLQYGRYRGRVASAIRGQRGQKMLRDLLAALDAMPQKRLANGFFETPAGDVCALGALGRARGVDIATLDEDDHEALEDALRGMLDVVADSSGVYGYHLNGELSPWSEFPEVKAAEKALESTP